MAKAHGGIYNMVKYRWKPDKNQITQGFANQGNIFFSSEKEIAIKEFMSQAV